MSPPIAVVNAAVKLTVELVKGEVIAKCVGSGNINGMPGRDGHIISNR